MSTVYALSSTGTYPVIGNGAWGRMALQVHFDNVKKGFWPAEGRNFGEIVALMHSELAEAWEGWNVSPRAIDEKLPQYLNVYVEVADCAIRLLDMLGIFNSAMLDVLNVEDYIEPYLEDAPKDFTVSKYRSMAENLRTIDSYLARALEADRKGDNDMRLASLEDAFMTCLALLTCHAQPSLEIIEAKLAYNRSRPFKHGKAFG